MNRYGPSACGSVILDESDHALATVDYMKVNTELFDKIIDTVQDCVFWKDKDRRFIGVNKAFLDFYGFESDKVLIGKTDEDMGWHNDPEPYKQDELRVLAGESTYKVPGKCVIRGEERDIIASKSPVYENGEVVGLIGSFIDVTETLRKEKGAFNAQIMYDRERLKQYPYFSKLMDETGLDEILDSLTGVISRGYILDFAKSLISAGTRFTFAILDLDNFKYINDTYGHRAGDTVLMDVSRNLAEYVGYKGLVGRFGGDELLIINLEDFGYDEKKQFYEKMFVSEKVLRKHMLMEGADTFITGTIGSATFPDDATDYDRLFELIDKTLYRGKSKGRNCYIIYVEAKHKDLEIKKLAAHSIYDNMMKLTEFFEGNGTVLERFKKTAPVIAEELQVPEIFVVDEDGILKNVLRGEVHDDVSDIKKLLTEGVYSENTMSGIERKSPKLYASLKKYGIDAVIIAKVGMANDDIGYLICCSTRKQRLWQEDECALAYYVAKMLALHLKLNSERLSSW